MAVQISITGDRIALWTMVFTAGGFLAAAVYAWLTYRLLRSAQATSLAATLTQLVANNRSLTEYAANDSSLMDVLRGDVKDRLTAKQYAFISMITSQIMCCFECSRLGVLPKTLFEGIKLAFLPMLSSKAVADAVLKICETHPDLKKLVEEWLGPVSGRSGGG